MLCRRGVSASSVASPQISNAYGATSPSTGTNLAMEQTMSL